MSSSDTPAYHDPLDAGIVLCGRYRLDAPVAGGGMGSVWQATDTELDRTVAVKVLHPHLRHDPAVAARFRREARSAARLHHPAIVGVYDICSHEGIDAIVLQYIKGPTLRNYLDRVRRLTNEQAVAVVTSVAEALVAAHSQGIIHRDIKPANILFGPDRAMLADFGVARAIDDADHTATGTMLGSVRYLSPEQVEGGPLDQTSDIFSVGVVLYECVCGSTPWSEDTPTATALARLNRPATPPSDVNPSVSPQLESVILWCLARHHTDRLPDATTLVGVLDGLDQGASLPPATTASPPPETSGSTALMDQPVQRGGPDPTLAGTGSDEVTTTDGPDSTGDHTDDHQRPVTEPQLTTKPVMPVIVALLAVAVLAALIVDLQW